MSWVERVQNNMVITTGDGKEYRPNWMNATKSKEYNISEFNFPDVAGTLVTRKAPRGRRYSLELYFQGEDHIDQSNAFETSCDDSREWVISHPYYDRILCHPVSLAFDNTKYNVTKITAEILETIDNKRPKTGVDPAEEAQIQKETLDETVNESFANDVTPNTDDINQMTEINNEIYNEGKKSIINDLDFQNYFNAFKDAESAILDATDDAFQAMNKLQAVINAPFQFIDSVRNRINSLRNQFQKLRSSIQNLLNPSSKNIYEATASTFVSAIALSSLTNINYQNAGEVLDVIDDILISYQELNDDLDSLQTDNGGNEDSYIPDLDSQVQLNNLIVFVVNNLLDVALNSRQERRVFIEDDSNLINLVHRFTGLDGEDENIDSFIEDNNIGLNEILQIKKGREIIYYV